MHKVPLRSFHLEMLARMAFSAYKIEDYAGGVGAFFAKTNYLLDLYKNSPFVPEPGGNSVYVDQYLYANPFLLAAVKQKIKAHFAYAQKAFDYMQKGQIGFAKQVWGRILGSGFYTPPTLPSPFSSLLMSPAPPQTTFPSLLSELLRRRIGNGDV